jgi:hypothetical protein
MHCSLRCGKVVATGRCRGSARSPGLLERCHLGIADVRMRIALLLAGSQSTTPVQQPSRVHLLQTCLRQADWRSPALSLRTPSGLLERGASLGPGDGSLKHVGLSCKASRPSGRSRTGDHSQLPAPALLRCSVVASCLRATVCYNQEPERNHALWNLAQVAALNVKVCTRALLLSGASHLELLAVADVGGVQNLRSWADRCESCG